MGDGNRVSVCLSAAEKREQTKYVCKHFGCVLLNSTTDCRAGTNER